MYKIYYHTHDNSGVIKSVSTIGEVASILEGLYKARIKATAYRVKDKLLVGQVWKLDGRLTWSCDT